MSPPLFNRYEDGQSYGPHIDNALRQGPDEGGRVHRMRSDLSATLFLTPPQEYDGGELTVEDAYGTHSVKLPAGHMVLYPAGSLHEVKPVTRGRRLAAFFWVQSVVCDEGRRGLLVELELAIQAVHRDQPEHVCIGQLTGIYNNLLRRWAEIQGKRVENGKSKGLAWNRVERVSFAYDISDRSDKFLENGSSFLNLFHNAALEREVWYIFRVNRIIKTLYSFGWDSAEKVSGNFNAGRFT